MEINWYCKKFDALLPFELYDLLRLRSEVFVVEQKCIFLDMDDNDQKCYHLLGYDKDTLAAYTRLVPPGAIYTEASIGRVVSRKATRRTGIGKALMDESIKRVYELFGEQPIKIGAQLYLKEFYGSFGFRQVSGIYMEDYIEHIYMIKN
ncbi:MAG TPA: GNAT family N-acetyltransferase [Chitinophagaceae bacterium]|nr:GNAT family N-acetyltransferase [Chitinophagaceae bacterium]